MHIAANPAYPTIRRVTTQGRLLGADINELTNLGYDIVGALVTLTNPAAAALPSRITTGCCTKTVL